MVAKHSAPGKGKPHPESFRTLLAAHSNVEIRDRWGLTVGFVASLRHKYKHRPPKYFHHATAERVMRGLGWTEHELPHVQNVYTRPDDDLWRGGPSEQEVVARAFRVKVYEWMWGQYRRTYHVPKDTYLSKAGLTAEETASRIAGALRKEA